MYSGRGAAQLAARVRSLIRPSDSARVREIADELGLSAVDLREIVQHETPYPSVTVLAAIVAYYGVDAGWLLTGDYSPSLHRAGEESGLPPRERLAKVLRDEVTSAALEEGEPARERLVELLREFPSPPLP